MSLDCLFVFLVTVAGFLLGTWDERRRNKRKLDS
jgi:hypothetical protein